MNYGILHRMNENPKFNFFTEHKKSKILHQNVEPKTHLKDKLPRQEIQLDRESGKSKTTFLENVRRIFHKSPILRATAMALAIEVSMIGCELKKNAEQGIEMRAPPESAENVDGDLASVGLAAKYDTLKTYLGEYTPRFADQRQVHEVETPITITVNPGMPDSAQTAATIGRLIEGIRGGLSKESGSEIGYNPDVAAGPLVVNELEIQRKKITGDQLREYMLQVFPRGWVGQEIDTIRVVENLDTTIEKVADGTIAMVCHTSSSTHASEIYINPAVLTRTPKTVIACLSHEVAHANSDDTDREMTEEQRVNLLLKIIRRVLAPDRYQSEYVESITDKNPNRQLFIKAEEYWAEIFSAYFSNPQSLNIKDLRIVERQIHLTDPTYDVATAIQKTQTFVRSIEQSNQ